MTTVIKQKLQSKVKSSQSNPCAKHINPGLIILFRLALNVSKMKVYMFIAQLSP